MSLYGRTADAYGRRRAEDPRIAAMIHDALGDARTVVNVGAGKGAYEPRDRDVTPVEPEPAMSGSRPAHYQTPAQVLDALGGGEIQTVPISHDCRDGFFGAYWRRPHAYLDPDVQQSISSLALLDTAVRERGLGALDRDLKSGAWEQRHADLIDRTELDLGYRPVIARHN